MPIRGVISAQSGSGMFIFVILHHKSAALYYYKFSPTCAACDAEVVSSHCTGHERMLHTHKV
jgi:hypothetical protein